MGTIVPRALSLLSPQPPHNTKRPLERREMQLRERIILNSEMADLNSNFNSTVEASVLELDRLGMSRVLRNEKVKAISTLASGQDLLALLKPTPPTQLFMPKCFLFQTVLFFFWRVDYALEGSMFWPSKCDFRYLFRSGHAYWSSVVFEFLVFIICPLMQERFLWLV